MPSAVTTRPVSVSTSAGGVVVDVVGGRVEVVLLPKALEVVIGGIDDVAAVLVSGSKVSSLVVVRSAEVEVGVDDGEV